MFSIKSFEDCNFSEFVYGLAHFSFIMEKKCNLIYGDTLPSLFVKRLVLCQVDWSYYF